MSLFPKMNRTLFGTSVAALGAGVCLAAIAQQPPREPPRQPDRPAERPGDRAGPTHTAVVVDLMSYIKKTEEHERRQRERPPRDVPDRPTPPPRDPGTPPGASASSEAPPPPPPGRDQPRDRDRDRDRGIDWTAGDYRDNLEAGVPMVLMIEEDSPWGAGEKRPHVVAFDPNDSDGKASFRELKNSAGQRVEVSGDVHKQRAIRGLRVLTVKDVH